MDTWLLTFETTLRLGIFLTLLILMASLEIRFPRRSPLALHAGKSTLISRFNNLGLAASSTLIMKLLLPLSLASFALYCQNNQWGLLNQPRINALALPGFLTLLTSLLIFDLIIYWQHRLFHKIPIFWQLHKVHHSDINLDVSTGIRFHPIEILLSQLIKFSVIFIFGFSITSVIVFEILLNALALFNHSNVRLPLRLDFWLRKIIVTPDMHRVHHSKIWQEHNSNFGFNISLWDKVFHSYQDQPKLGHQHIDIGLPQYNDSDTPLRFSQLLIMPFKKH